MSSVPRPCARAVLVRLPAVGPRSGTTEIYQQIQTMPRGVDGEPPTGAGGTDADADGRSRGRWSRWWIWRGFQRRHDWWARGVVFFLTLLRRTRRNTFDFPI